MKWSPEAEEAVSRVPFFIRKRVKKRVQEEARSSGAEQVTPERVRACQERFLERMEQEVKGYQVETCFGRSGCPNRAVRDDALPAELERCLSARDLRAFLKKRVKGPLKLHHDFRVSVSDCPNACSRPQIVDAGLIGACAPHITNTPCSGCGACVETCREKAISLSEKGPAIDPGGCLFCGQCLAVCPTGTLGRGKEGYRVLVGGKLGRHPRLGTEIGRIFAADEVPRVLCRILDYYQEHCERGERLGELMERGTPPPFDQVDHRGC